MRIGAWLLCASWLFTWAACKCQDMCPSGQGLDKRSKTRVKEHVRHSGGHQHALHRKRPLRRKASRVHMEETPPLIVLHPSDVVVKVGNPASLSCRADGSPKPTIEWLYNGQPLEAAKEDGHWQSMVLSEGRLFFLRVGGGGRRGQSQEGVYTCVARNSAGVATSRNASLYIAALQEEFSVEPSDVEVAEGDVAVLNCGPPAGHPEPNVVWKKDGWPIKSSDQHYTELSGRLIIAPAEKNHSGAYVCVARNTVGVRESRAARLSVMAKPVLVLKPENVSVKMGESAQFYCQAKGDPPPSVLWSREQGPLPNGRYLVNPDQTLQIHYVTAQDAGKYICTAENHVGVVTASAQLQVEEVTVQKDLHKELSTLRVALENVTIVAPGSNISQVQWKLQFLPAKPHYLDGFEVLYRSLLPASSDWAAKKVPLPGFQAQVGPLMRGYKYEFKVRPYGGNLYGRESNTRHFRVPETVPSASPLAVSIAVNHELNNTIHLSWEPPPHETHNGIIQGYQVWCVESEERHYQNWTVDSGEHSLDISTLKAGTRYWLTMAAVNGAGVGTLSDPHGIVISSQTGGPPEPDGRKPHLSQVLLQDPVLIGIIGALLWCVLMVAAVYLCRHHSRTGRLIPGHGKAKGLRRLASEDLIIKHSMVAPDSPWISGGWRPAFSQKYQDLWAQGQKHPGVRSTSLPVSSKNDPRCLDSVVPIVTDSCGVYGTFYVDLTANGLETFNSPGRRPKMPHGLPHQQGAETIQIFPQPVAKTMSLGSRDVLPWKQGIRPQPKMGVLRESWEKNSSKQELHAVNSVPIVPTRNQACPPGVYKPRLSHVPPGRHGGYPVCGDVAGSPRLLHYSASLHLVDMLPPPPLRPVDDGVDTHSLTSDEGSSRSTKLTVDTGSLQSVCAESGRRGHPGLTASSRPSHSHPSHSHLSTSSYTMSLDEDHGGTLTAQEATQYLELTPKPERYSALPEQRCPLSHTFSPSLSYMCGPARATHPEDVLAADELEAPPIGLRRARLQSTPSSCYSEWDSSLWNTWSSVMDSDAASARTSLISSVDSCYTTDSAHFAHLLAVAADTMSGASLSDFSPPASPLSALYPAFHAEGDALGEPEPVPAWDWSMAWVEEMEARYRDHYPSRSTKPFNA